MAVMSIASIIYVINKLVNEAYKTYGDAALIIYSFESFVGV